MAAPRMLDAVSMKIIPKILGSGKYIQYSRIFHTFACAKISRRISLPHYAVLS